MRNWNLEDYNRKEPFKVPEGYFESLSSRVMDNLPEQKTVIIPQKQGFRYLFYAAAIFIGFIVCSGLLYTYSDSEEVRDMAIQDSIYMDEMMNYTMMDYFTIHQYLTDASGE